MNERIDIHESACKRCWSNKKSPLGRFCLTTRLVNQGRPQDAMREIGRLPINCPKLKVTGGQLMVTTE